MANNLLLPPDYQAQMQGVQRQQALAQALQQQGMQPLQSRRAGRFVVAPSPLEGIAKVLQTVAAAKMGQKADTQGADIMRQVQEQRGQTLAQALAASQGSPQPAAELGGGPAMPADPVRGMGMLAQSADPALMQIGAPVFNMQQQQINQREARAATASEGAANREARSAEAHAAREARALEAETARQYRLAQEERDRAFRREEGQRNREFRSEERAESQAFRAEQSAQAAELRKVLAESARQNKPLSEFQGRNVLFGARMAAADKTLRGLEDTISTTGLAVKQGAQNIPLIGGMLGAAGNVMLSKEQQRVEQAQRDFVNAVLRQESGAVINPDEFDNAKKQYFPQPGDSKEVKEQKRQNRQIAISAFKQLAGPGADQIDMLANMPQLPGSVPQPGSPAPAQSDAGVIDFSALPQDRRGGGR